MVKKILNIIFVITAVSIIGYCGYNIISTLQERYLSKQEYTTITESYVSAIHEEEKSELEEAADEADIDEEFPQLNVDSDGLTRINQDYVAWLYYKDADISYPIVQSTKKNQDKYLATTFEGNSNPSGCIFMDYNEDDAFRFQNQFLYGHNMANGTMFGSLKKLYQNPKDATDPYFYIYTKYGWINKYRVFAVYVTEENDETAYSVPETDDAYDKYIAKAMQKGSFASYVALTNDERSAISERQPLVTLSTCFGKAGTTKRLLVHGILVDSQTYTTSAIEEE